MTVKGEAILRIEKQYKDLILNIGSVLSANDACVFKQNTRNWTEHKILTQCSQVLGYTNVCPTT